MAHDVDKTQQIEAPAKWVKIKTGQRYGKLTVLACAGRKHGHIRWTCVCDCGNKTEVRGTNLVRSVSASCGCSRVRRGDKNPYWTGYGSISGSMMTDLKRGASGAKGGRAAMAFEVDAKYLWGLFKRQRGLCALSGMVLTMPRFTRDTKTASLDRIDSSRGYVRGNVQWVHKDVNRMKNTFEQRYFIEMCQRIAKNFKR